MSSYTCAVFRRLTVAFSGLGALQAMDGNHGDILLRIISVMVKTSEQFCLYGSIPSSEAGMVYYKCSETGILKATHMSIEQCKIS